SNISALVPSKLPDALDQRQRDHRAIPKISKKQSFGCSFFYFQPVKKLKKQKNFKKLFMHLT
ncbi:hypothetical protein RCG42_07300, partial [Lactobacillus delbrueckii subsp. lactis]|uniref:hypothetical protein n=1 Tax=Lactobacillus delbrueckii TaxID=1584 RepID=UPI0027FFB4C7